MNTQSQNAAVANWMILVLGVVAAFIIFLVLAGKPVPLISGERVAFFVLVAIGLVMCTVGGIGPAVSGYGWMHPLTVTGSIFGVLILLLSVKVLTGFSIPVIVTDRDAIIALAVMSSIKIAINLLYPVLFSR